ncbi:hypothetical protein [Vibrio sp. D431a]|uniref:hypothetical protein n=1 Tax=Vibrio sp. D431a TaxID=2837388 RepID=UPI00255266BF|nr:hypothetical protein [Vibrio sp. D431a]MDK9789934.1 hypothetical protein [Vibrio sp. D431a]
MLRTIEYNEIKGQSHIEAIMVANGRILAIAESVIQGVERVSAKDLTPLVGECAGQIVSNFDQLCKKESFSTDYELELIQIYMGEIYSLATRAMQIEQGMKVYKPT